MPKTSSNKPLISVIFVTLILIVTIGYTARSREKISFTEGVVGAIMSPFQRIAFSVGKFFENNFRSITEIATLRETNKRLQEENEQINRENVVLNEALARFSSLGDIEAVKEEFAIKEYLEVKIVSKSPGNWFNRFTINKGSNDGISQYMTVVTGKGLVGTIGDVGPNWAEVITIVDADSNASFISRRSQDFGVLRGTLDSEIIATIELDSNILEGDQVTTSGIGGIYPKGILIGEVEKIQDESQNLIKNVTIKPSVDFKRLEYVYVILESNIEEQQSEQ